MWSAINSSQFARVSKIMAKPSRTTMRTRPKPHFPKNQKRMQLAENQKHPNIDAELSVMTKLCEALDNYVSGLQRSNKSAMVQPTIVHAIATTSTSRGAKSHERLLHH